MKPVLLTRELLAARAAAAWRWQHRHVIPARFRMPDGRAYADVADALDALGATPDPGDVDRVIGHESWTEVPPCSGCGASVPLVVQVGEDPEADEPRVAYLCPGCAREALALLGVVA